MKVEKNRPQRVAAIHDMSGFGRCSLTVILPILSVMGVQVCPIPTAVLSTHTGGLGEVVFRDLTDYIKPTLEHYQRLDLDFECIYTGFLGSESQIGLCREFMAAYPDAIKVVDPVMGDHGKPYRTYTLAMQQRMHEMVSVADVITPNLTESYMLLGEVYDHTPITRSQGKSMLSRLAALGPKNVVITGVQLASGEMVNLGYDAQGGRFWCVTCDYVPVSYPGTGDIFASVFIGAYLSGDSLPIAMNRATRFAEFAIKTTFSYNTDPRYGVQLERTLEGLTKSEVLKDFQTL